MSTVPNTPSDTRPLWIRNAKGSFCRDLSRIVSIWQRGGFIEADGYAIEQPADLPGWYGIACYDVDGIDAEHPRGIFMGFV